MAHYAYLDENNVVVDVIVGRNEDEVVDGISDWEAYYGSLRGQACKRTSYNTKNGVRTDPETGITSEGFRGNYAAIDYTYDEALDAFIPWQPYPSWTFTSEIYDWSPPVPVPDDGKMYSWDEDTLSWELIDFEFYYEGSRYSWDESVGAWVLSEEA